jgi:hypothetical protein
LLDGDPLDLELRCQQRKGQLAYLISRRRLFLRTVARCAHDGFGYDADSMPIESWITDRIDQSIREILDEDEFGLHHGAAIESPDHYALVIEHLGVEPETARAAHVAFNEQPEAVRETFFALAVRGSSVAEYSANGGGSAREIERYMKSAIDLLVRFRNEERGREST